MSENEEIEIQLKVSISDEVLRRFKLIKKHYGFRTNAELVRNIILNEYNRLKEEKAIKDILG